MFASNTHKPIEEMLQACERLPFRSSAENFALVRRVLALAQEENDPSHLARASFYYAMYGYYNQLPREDINAALATALEKARMADEPLIEARTYNLMAVASQGRNDWTSCIDYLIAAQSCCAHATGPASLRFSYNLVFNMGYIYEKLQSFPKALGYANQAIEVGDQYAQAAGLTEPYAVTFEAHVLRGQLLVRMGQVDEAKAELAQIISHVPQDDTRRSFHYVKLYDLKLRLYYIEKNMALLQSATTTFLSDLRDEGLATDQMRDLAPILNFLVEIGYTDIALDIVDTARPFIQSLPTSYMKSLFVSSEILLFEALGEQDRVNSLARKYHELMRESAADERSSALATVALRQSMEELKNREVMTLRENERLSRRADRDALTGIPNRYPFNRKLASALDRAFNGRGMLGVEIFDIDDFKHFNDTFGHQMGDKVLAAIAETLLDVTSNYDEVTCARWGGDEFVILFDDMADEKILAIALELNRRIAELDLGPSQPKITQGICNSVPGRESQTWDYLAAADHALYQAKRGNKGGIALLGSTMIDGERYQEEARFIDA